MLWGIIRGGVFFFLSFFVPFLLTYYGWMGGWVSWGMDVFLLGMCHLHRVYDIREPGKRKFECYYVGLFFFFRSFQHRFALVTHARAHTHTLPLHIYEGLDRGKNAVEKASRMYVFLTAELDNGKQASTMHPSIDASKRRRTEPRTFFEIFPPRHFSNSSQNRKENTPHLPTNSHSP